MSTEQWSNRSRSTLDGAITDSATTLTIDTPAAGQDFPATGPFRAICGTEIMLVGTRTGTTFSDLTRGYEGTTAAAHSDGAVISHGITAGALSDLQAGTAVAGHWEPLTNMDPDAPELVFVDGLCVVVWVED